MAQNEEYGGGDDRLVPNYRDATIIHKEAQEYMRHHGIEAMETVVPKHKPAGTYSEDTIRVTTNMYGVAPVPMTVHRYRIEVCFPGKESSEHSPSDGSENGNGEHSPDENGNGSNGNGHGSASPDNSVENGSAPKFQQLFNMAKLRQRGDPGIIHRRNMFRAVWKKLLAQNRDVFTEDAKHYWYDLETTFFTHTALPINKMTKYTITTSPNFFPELAIIVVMIQPTGIIDFDGNLKLGITIGGLNLKNIDYKFIQFLEIVTNQAPLFNLDECICFPSGKTYLKHPDKYTFAGEEIKKLPGECYVGIGSQKAIRYVEGLKPRSDGASMAMVVETKKTPFHLPITVSDKAFALGLIDYNGRAIPRFSQNDFNQALAGLFVESRVIEPIVGVTTRSKLMRIHAIELSETAATKRFHYREIGGADANVGFVTVQEYWAQYKNINLVYPNSPVALTKMGQKFIYWPLEILKLAEYQRVSTEKQTPEMIAELIKASAILPLKMIDQVSKNAKALQLADSEYSHAADVTVCDWNIQVDARRLAHPTIEYRHGITTQVNNLGSWNVRPETNFLIPGGCTKWAVTMITDRSGYGNMDTFKEFLTQMVQLARSRGMTLPDPSSVAKIPNSFHDLTQLFERMIDKEIEFAFFVTADGVKNMHDAMKLLECQYEIVTQDLMMKTMDAVVVRRQRLTLENILMKTNVKLGGLNHSIRIDKPEFQELLSKSTLYVGLGMNHPAAGMKSMEELETKDEDGKEKPKNGSKPLLSPPPPSVVGFAANDGKHPFEFTGDYVYQASLRDEKVTLLSRQADGPDQPLLQELFETMIGRFQKNRNSLPKRIVVYRNGCSEGQFANVLVYEVPFIKEAMKKLGCADATLTFIVPNKLHNVRLFPTQADPNTRAPEQNIKPGYVVDTNIVHPSIQDFYLCSHATLQGTAKIPHYTVLYSDDEGLDADALHQMTYALSYGHQIVRSPTSLPSPTFIAGAYAERGRKVLNAFMFTSNEYKNMDLKYRGKAPREGEYAGAVPAVFESQEQFDKLRLFNAEITLHNRETLRSRRINA